MNRIKLCYSFLALVSLGLLMACGGTAKLPYAREKGKILDDFTIKLSDKNVTLKPNDLFDLAQLGIVAGKKEWTWNAAETVNAYREIDQDKYPYYNITVTKSGYKNIYGRILFLNLSKKAFDQNKSRYYELRISPQQFESAKNGLACIYDYVPKNGKKASKATIEPTWIIWLSDSPL